MGMEKQAGRQRPGGCGHQWGKELVPQRDVVIAAERLRKDQCGSDGRAEKRPDGACGGENGPVQRANAGQNA
jgi:isocitrate lyase